MPSTIFRLNREGLLAWMTRPHISPAAPSPSPRLRRVAATLSPRRGWKAGIGQLGRPVDRIILGPVNGWMIRVTRPLGGEPPAVQLYAVAEADVAAAVRAVRERTGALPEQIEAVEVLNPVALAALGLKPGEVCVI